MGYSLRRIVKCDVCGKILSDKIVDRGLKTDRLAEDFRHDLEETYKDKGCSRQEAEYYAYSSTVNVLIPNKKFCFGNLSMVMCSECREQLARRLESIYCVDETGFHFR